MRTILLTFLLLMPIFGHSLTFKQFMDEVKSKNSNIKINELNTKSSYYLSKEAELLTSPEFFMNTQWMQDRKEPNPPISYYDKLRTTTAIVGVSQQFENGLQVKLSYSATKNDFDTTSFDKKKYWDLSPSLDFIFPMWGEGFGKGAQIQKDLSKSQYEMNKFSNDASVKTILIEAEVIYWQLSLANEKLSVQEQALNAAKNILKYVTSQKNKNLGDSADVIQANALVDANVMQLQMIKNEKNELERKLTKILNNDEIIANLELEKVSYEELEKTILPKNIPANRIDTNIKKSLRDISISNSILIDERLKPKLNLIGGYSIQGRNLGMGGAVSDSFKGSKDTGYIGLNLSIPLNFSTLNEVKAGAAIQRNSAEIALKQAQFEQIQDWNDLYGKVEEAKNNLLLNRKLEKTQKLKLDLERIRLHQGRTTTYQILLFEQDYTQAQISKIMAAAQLITLKSQTKLYSEEN